jgi:hypothetical protein
MFPHVVPEFITSQADPKLRADRYRNIGHSRRTAGRFWLRDEHRRGALGVRGMFSI